MGKGKGGISEYVAVVQSGHLLLEVEGTSFVKLLNALKKIEQKLHLPTKIVKFLL
jgi:ribosomal protein L16/L10AE